MTSQITTHHRSAVAAALCNLGTAANELELASTQRRPGKSIHLQTVDGQIIRLSKFRLASPRLSPTVCSTSQIYRYMYMHAFTASLAESPTVGHASAARGALLAVAVAMWPSSSTDRSNAPEDALSGET